MYEIAGIIACILGAIGLICSLGALIYDIAEPVQPEADKVNVKKLVAENTELKTKVAELENIVSAEQMVRNWSAPDMKETLSNATQE